MPSREYVEKMLTTGNSNEEEAEEVEENLGHDDEMSEVSGEATEAVEDSVITEEEDAPSEEAEGPEEAEEEAPEEEEEQAEEEEPTEAAHGDEFYLGTYKSREEAEKGWLEKEQHISRLAEEMHQMRERQAQYEGYMAALAQQQTAASTPGEFEAWAEQYFEAGQAHVGWQEVLEAYQQTGDEDYLDTYVDMWKEHDPYEAARMRNLLDTAAAMNQQQQLQQMPQAPSVQDTINESWVAVAQTDPDLKDEEFARGVGRILTNVPALRAAALSGDPEQVKSAISVARDGYRMQARTGNGTPRKMKSSDAEKLQKDKLDATVTTGDSAPERGRASTPEVPPELQDMMQRIQQGEGGFPKLKDF